MSMRHREREPRHHDLSPAVHHHALNVHPAHAQAAAAHPHAPVMNGSGPIPSTPGGMSNGSHPAAAGASQMVVSPATAPMAPPNGAGPSSAPSSSAMSKLASANEQTWLLIGRVAEQMGDLEHALSAYENALRHNPTSLAGLTQVAGIARIKEDYPKAIHCFQEVLKTQEENGEVWSAMGHCYLMQDDLQKAYQAYQQALYLLPNPKEDPKLWYGIGILYDRYGSLDHAEEAFASVLRMDKELDFDKANEILFRLGIIYKQQGKYDESLGCFDRILRSPPSPLAHADIWFQIGHVYEQQKDPVRAKDAYERVVADMPGHAKVLQQLGWLYHQDGSTFQNQETAIQYLTKSLEADPSDAQSWYLLGRAYMAGQKYNKAYEAYQQAVYRDGRNPTFWCSIGVLYFQINQFRDALDAYSRAIRINPYISEVWFDLGSLYESCNNQISDAIDAYARASELDPSNTVISRRLHLLQHAQATGGALPAAPGPQDVHPTAYANSVIPPPGLTGPPLLLSAPNTRPMFRSDSREPDAGMPLPPTNLGGGRGSPPFRGGPPPPVIIDETRHAPSHTPLAPMDVDTSPHHHAHHDFSGPGGSRGGPASHLLLHHPVPQQQVPHEELRSAAHGASSGADALLSRPLRVQTGSVSPPHHSSRARSPAPPPFQYTRPSGGPGSMPSPRSPRAYPRDGGRAVDEREGWERRGPPLGEQPPSHREWEGESRRGRHPADYPPPYQATRSPPTRHRAYSPPEPSPRSEHPSRAYWDPKPPSLSRPPSHARGPSPPPSRTRYDPRSDAREAMVDPRQEGRSLYMPSPEGLRGQRGVIPPPQSMSGGSIRGSESPRPTPAPEKRKRGGKDKDSDAGDPTQKRERKKRTRKPRDDGSSRQPTPKAYDERASLSMGAPFRASYPHPKSTGSPEPSSTESRSSNRSVQPSPTMVRPPSRVVDEDYDGAESLIDLAQRPPEMGGPPPHHSAPPSHSPTVSTGSRGSPRAPPRSHRDSNASRHSDVSPPPRSSHSTQSGPLKRALSPGPDEMGESKRSRMDVRHVSSSSNGRHTPVQSTRPSPIPFRTQPAASRSPEERPERRRSQDSFPASPPLPAVLPPHPRPLGAGSSAQLSSSVALPPIATLPPNSRSRSGSPPPPAQREDERMQVDEPRSASPSARSRTSNVLHSSESTSPQGKATPSPTSSVHGREKSDHSG